MKSFHSELNHWSKAVAASPVTVTLPSEFPQHTHLLPPPHKRTCWEIHKQNNNSCKSNTAFSQQTVGNRMHTLRMLWQIPTSKKYQPPHFQLIPAETQHSQNKLDRSVSIYWFFYYFSKQMGLVQSMFYFSPSSAVTCSSLWQFQTNIKAEITVHYNQKSPKYSFVPT